MGIFRSPQCIVCGRAVRGPEDARKEGKLWFCSPSHHLSYRGPSETKTRKRTGRRVVKWVVIVLALLVVLALIPAFVGSGTKSRKQAKAAHKTVARGPGSRAHPIPVRRSASVGGGWKLKVVSATPNATRLVLKADSSAKSPARGGQDFMLFVAATYTSGGKSRFGGSGLPSFTDQLFAVGKHRAIYRLTTGLSACGPSSVHLPKPDAQGNGEDIFSGQSVRGNICFEIASNDASTLKLYVERPYNESNKPIVWFALR